MKKVKLGFIGIGHYCRHTYLKQFASNPNVEIIGAYDIAPGAFIRAKEMYGVELQYFENPEWLMVKCDAIVIASPDDSHLAYLLAATKLYGLHTLVEKPVCTTKEEYNDLCFSLDNYIKPNIIITTAHPRRFDNAYITARDLVQNGQYGKLLRVELSVVKSKLPDPTAYGNSLLQDHLSHEIDTFNFFMGSVQKLNLHILTDGPYRYEASGSTKDGVSVYFSSYANIEDKGRYEEGITLHFEDAKVFIDCSDQFNSVITNYKLGIRHQFMFPPRDKAKRNQDLADNFINAILGKEDIYLSLDETVASAASILIK